MNFRQLGLIDPILSALNEQGYTAPTPIQRGAIPPALAGRDVLGCAQTGTGKTCAFATPILQRLHLSKDSPRSIRSLILTPTRELALQIGESFEAYGKHLPLRTAVIFGGVGQQPQVDRIRRGVDILVATPGRLLDLHNQQLLDLSQIQIFVLDEADRMLDMGFIHDVRKVIKLLPEKKQTLFFSATMPPEVMDLVNALLHDYARVEVDPVSSPVEIIRQSLYFVDKSNKTKLLAHLIQQMNMDSVLVFSRTKHGANRIAGDLAKQGISAAAIHGNKSQTARQQALSDFKSGTVRTLVATDIAARGIDIDELKWVVNYDLPEVPETYVHRIGRTGRAGHDGSALSFCRADEMDYLKQIERLLGRKLPVVEDHPFPMTEAATGVSPMVQARQEARENARANRAAKAKHTAEVKHAAEVKPAVKDTPARPEHTAAKKSDVSPKAKPAAEVKRTAESKAEAPAPLSPDQKKRKKSRKARQTDAQTTAPAPAPLSEPNPPAVKEQPRSRQTLRKGDLSATAPAAPAMPSSDFVRPDPLASDVIMDATARLLAPRKPIYSQPKSVPAQDEPAKKTPSVARQDDRRKEHRREAAKTVKEPVKAAKDSPKHAKESFHAVKEPPKAAKNPAKGAKSAVKSAKEPPKALPLPAAEPHKPEQSVSRQEHSAKRHERGIRRPSLPRSYSGSHRQMDSTEHRGSIIKPYYLSDD